MLLDVDKVLTVAEAIAKLSQMPPEAILLFEVAGSDIAKITNIQLEPGSPLPEESEDLEYLNPNLFKPRAVFSASPEEQVNKLADYIKALINAIPDRQQALRIKSGMGINLTADDLSQVADLWNK